MKKRLTLAVCAAVLAASIAIPAPHPFGPNVTYAVEDVNFVYPRHQPYGTGIGAMPGRVVWAHEPQSVDWDGTGYWWEPTHFDEDTVLTMVNSAIATLADQPQARAGWDTLFAAHNQSRGKAGGYRSGERIAIKANINGSAVFDSDTSGETQMSYTNPVLLKMLLLSLVEEAGVLPSDIAVYDVSRLFPDYMVEMCTEGRLQGVTFIDRDNGVADENAPIAWSYAFSGAVNYLPTCVTQAEYVINLANLKGHSYGITLCGKNHFGSFLNGNAMRPPEGANLHQFLSRNEMGIYSPLVDLMANENLGGKTVLYMLDALICAPSEGAAITGDNAKWQQAPFDGDYTSSVFVSQDPVAIDSVGADFLMNEPAVTSRNSALKDNPNVENYLHEAGLVSAAPSGTDYTNGRGQRITNLGVHEHWHSQTEKLYSRNLGGAEGIELVMAVTQQKADVAFENGVVTVSNAPLGSALIVAAYTDSALTNVRLYRGDGTFKADLAEFWESADSVRVYLWDRTAITAVPTPVEPEESNDNSIGLSIDGHRFTATLYDSETARAFRSRLPMTLDMNELNGNEKYHFLTSPLPTAAERPQQINAGDLMLYGADCVVLFYETFDSAYSYTPIGRIDDVAGWKEALGSGSVTVLFE